MGVRCAFIVSGSNTENSKMANILVVFWNVVWRERNYEISNVKVTKLVTNIRVCV